MKVPQYRRIKCPSCGNVCFKLVGLARVCVGPNGCGWAWDPGEAGRQVVAWREER